MEDKVIYYVWANSNGKPGAHKLRHCGFKHNSGADALIVVLEQAQKFSSLIKAQEAAEHFRARDYAVTILEELHGLDTVPQSPR